MPLLIACSGFALGRTQAANVVDKLWSVCAQRSQQAGRQLADVLLSRQQVCVASSCVKSTLVAYKIILTE